MNGPESFSGIKLNSTVTLQGTTYNVIGRLAYKGHDDEDAWIFEEWRLTDGHEDYWLEYEPEYPRFTLYKETTEQPIPNGSKVVDPDETATLTAFEGQIPWPARVGEQYTYTTYKIGPGKFYSVETDQGEKEYFEGTILATSEVKKAFGLSELPLRGPMAGLNGRMGMFNAIFWGLGILFVIVSSVTEGLNGFETPVFKTTFASATGTRLGPIRLERANHPYVVDVDSSLKFSSKPEVTFLLREATSEELGSVPASAAATVPAAPAPVVSTTGDFGRTLFRVTKPGIYVLEITGVRSQPASALTATVSENAYIAYALRLPALLIQSFVKLFPPT